jgi:hypothetical protein
MDHIPALERMIAMLKRGDDPGEVLSILLLLAKAMVREERGRG